MVLGAAVLYNAPKFISVALQALVLMLFFRAKNNSYWIAIFMFTSFNPGGLFHNLAPETLSIIEAPGFGTVTFNMAFTAVTIFKALFLRNWSYYKRYVIIFGVYMLLLIPLFGGSVTHLVRGFLSYSWLLFLPALIKEEAELFGLFRLIFLFNIVVLLMNIYQILTGLPFVHVLSSAFASSTSQYLYLYKQYDVDELVRTGYGDQFAFLAIAGSLYYLSFKISRFPQLILYLSLLVGFLNIVFSATRGWMLATFFIILGYSMFLVPKLFRNILVSIPSIIIIIILLMQVPVVRTQWEKSFERFSTTELILEGDISAGGTSSRHIRGAAVMSKYYESPLIGFGFGDETMEYADGHTGNQTMLLYFGAIGYGIYIIFWLAFMIGPVLLFRRLNARSDYRSLVFLPAFLLGGLIIIHSTSAMYLHPFSGGIFVAAIFALGNLIYQQARQEQSA